MKVKNEAKENIAAETAHNPLSPDLLQKINAYWRAANYLSVGQIYLFDNPLLKEPLKLSHVKPLVVGHWGTTPGQNFIYVHLNRVIKKYDFVNVVDLMKLQPKSEHPHGLSDADYDSLFTNGIEYGIMQLLAETYDLMKRGLEMNDDEISEVYALWNKGELNGYLMEITSQIFSKKDKKTSKRLIDEILDVAKQKGTGMWTSQSAMGLQVPIPTIDLAVAMRDLSVFEKERKQADMIYQRPINRLKSDRSTFLKQLQSALYAAMIITYAQGLALLAVASDINS